MTRPRSSRPSTPRPVDRGRDGTCDAGEARHERRRAVARAACVDDRDAPGRPRRRRRRRRRSRRRRSVRRGLRSEVPVDARQSGDSRMPRTHDRRRRRSRRRRSTRRDADLTPLIVSSRSQAQAECSPTSRTTCSTASPQRAGRITRCVAPRRRRAHRHLRHAIDDELAAAAAAGAATRRQRQVAAPQARQGAARSKPHATLLGEWLVNPLRDRLDRCVVDGAGDNDAIAKSVRVRLPRVEDATHRRPARRRAAHRPRRAVLAALRRRARRCAGDRPDASGLRRLRRQLAGRLRGGW